MATLTRAALEEWVREVWARLQEEGTPELRCLTLRGSPRGPRLVGAHQLARWDAEPGELPPATLVADTLWAEADAVGAPDWACVQARARVEGQLDLLSRQWTGPGLQEEEPSAPSCSQTDTSGQASMMAPGGYPATPGPQVMRELTLLVGELGRQAVAQARASVALAEGAAKVIPGLSAVIERQSRELVRSRGQEAEAAAQAARLEQVAEAAVEELTQREEEDGLVDRGLQAVAEALVRRIPGVDGPPSPALVLRAVEGMSSEELRSLAQSPQGQAIVARIMAAAAPAE